MAVKKRCGFCLEEVRADGTCQNEKCPRYVPENEQPMQDNTHGQEVIENGQ
jgi:hypothetical protein